MRSQIWEPDTCGCAIESSYDAKTDVFSYVRTIRACPAHAALYGDPSHYAVVLKENRAKNFTLQSIMDSMPELVETVQTRDGPVVQFVKGKEPSYAYVAGKLSAERKLVVTVDASQLKIDATKAVLVAEPVEKRAMTVAVEVVSKATAVVSKG